KHPVYDFEFRSLIGEANKSATNLHDNAAQLYLSGHFKFTLELLLGDNAPLNENSYFLIGKSFAMLGEFENAKNYLLEAIRLSQIKHDEYHDFASLEHVKRGRLFYAISEIDLAISDFTKALDLNNKNIEALHERAKCYRIKGNIRMAQEDECRI
ncbi:MAG: hypothetical protein WCJ33_09475, partial [Pseudomonadota bacterium]